VPELPAGASWLNDHYQAILLEQQQALLAQQLQQAQRAQQEQQQKSPGPTQGAALALPGQQAASPGAGGEGEGVREARQDKSRTVR